MIAAHELASLYNRSITFHCTQLSTWSSPPRRGDRQIVFQCTTDCDGAWGAIGGYRGAGGGGTEGGREVIRVNGMPICLMQDADKAYRTG